MQIFEILRKRRVLTKGADFFANIGGEDDIDRLQKWARNANSTNHSEDPFGQIAGVGLRPFLYLRTIAGIDTVKPDIQVQRIIESLAEATYCPYLGPSTDQTVREICQWIADEADYRIRTRPNRMVELWRCNCSTSAASRRARFATTEL